MADDDWETAELEPKRGAPGSRAWATASSTSPFASSSSPASVPASTTPAPSGASGVYPDSAQGIGQERARAPGGPVQILGAGPNAPPRQPVLLARKPSTGTPTPTPDHEDDWFRGSQASNRQIWDSANRPTAPVVLMAPSGSAPPPKLQILKRAGDAGPRPASAGSGTATPKTLAQREEEYRLARERIFGKEEALASGGTGSGAASPVSASSSGPSMPPMTTSALGPSSRRDEAGPSGGSGVSFNGAGYGGYGGAQPGAHGYGNFSSPGSNGTQGGSRSGRGGKRSGGSTPRTGSGRSTPAADELSRAVAQLSIDRDRIGPSSLPSSSSGPPPGQRGEPRSEGSRERDRDFDRGFDRLDARHYDRHYDRGPYVQQSAFGYSASGPGPNYTAAGYYAAYTATQQTPAHAHTHSLGHAQGLPPNPTHAHALSHGQGQGQYTQPYRYGYDPQPQPYQAQRYAPAAHTPTQHSQQPQHSQLPQQHPPHPQQYSAYGARPAPAPGYFEGAGTPSPQPYNAYTGYTSPPAASTPPISTTPSAPLRPPLTPGSAAAVGPVGTPAGPVPALRGRASPGVLRQPRGPGQGGGFRGA